MLSPAYNANACEGNIINIAVIVQSPINRGRCVNRPGASGNGTDVPLGYAVDIAGNLTSGKMAGISFAHSLKVMCKMSSDKTAITNRAPLNLRA